MSRAIPRQSLASHDPQWRAPEFDALASNQARRDEVTIWWANLRETQSRLGLQTHLLSPDELRRADWMPAPLARERWITGRAALRSILSGYLGLQAIAVPITYGALGKPELAGLSPVRFNLAHSANLAAFAVAWRKPIGIDIQRLREDADLIQLAEWIFSETAYRLWQALPEPERRLAFTRTWARKEAYLKARGLGLVYPMRDLEIVESTTGGAVRIVDKHADPGGGIWRIFDLDTPTAGYVAALAIEGKVSSLVTRGWPDGSVRTTWRPL